MRSLRGREKWMTQTKDALADLLARAESADAADRIDLRDAIAAHGAAAIEAVTPWLKMPTLAAFAIRVIARAGLDGERATAQVALRAARRRMDTRLRADVDWALSVLRVAPTAAVPAAPTRASQRRVDAVGPLAGARPARARSRPGLSAS
jgi:hypothetical protein